LFPLPPPGRAVNLLLLNYLREWLFKG